MIVTVAALALLAFAGPTLAVAQVPGLPVVPIVGDPLGGSATQFEGVPASPNPVSGGPVPPRNPFMAPNGRSNIHDDPYMSDTYALPGPPAMALSLRPCSPGSAGRSPSTPRAAS